MTITHALTMTMVVRPRLRHLFGGLHDRAVSRLVSRFMFVAVAVPVTVAMPVIITMRMPATGPR